MAQWGAEFVGDVIWAVVDGVLGTEGIGGADADLKPTPTQAPGAATTIVATIATVVGGKKVPTRSMRTVIGRVKDLKNFRPDERSLLDRLPNRGDPKLNWKQNAGVLRQEMRQGLPIRDASIGDTGGQFLNAERNLLLSHGWRLDPATGYWMPPRSGGY